MRLLDRSEVRAWWALAQTDLRVARAVAAIEPPAWSIVCFLAQQAGEKSVKAVLEALNIAVPRTHDLTALLDCLPEAAYGGELVEDAIHHSDFGVKPRYPVPAFEATEAQGRAAIAAAARIAGWAEGQLG